MNSRSVRQLVLLPSYNSGPRLIDVVAEVLAHWRPVIVVIDGSTDGSERPVLAWARKDPDLIPIVLERNCGKGAAVLVGARAALDRGFTHALVMDADRQHPASHIRSFMEASRASPAALVLGRPVFPANVPPARLHGRKISVALVRVSIAGAGIDDPLFGFRVYPLAPLLAALESRRWGRRYDFDTEAAVRLVWSGLPTINLAAPVRYFDRGDGGISHFRYGRDNLRLAWMHLRLFAELLLWRWPAVLARRRRTLASERGG